MILKFVTRKVSLLVPFLPLAALETLMVPLHEKEVKMLGNLGHFGRGSITTRTVANAKKPRENLCALFIPVTVDVRGVNAIDANNRLDVPVLSEILLARLPFFVKIRTEDPREKVLDRILTKRDITNCYAWPDGLTPASTNAP